MFKSFDLSVVVCVYFPESMTSQIEIFMLYDSYAKNVYHFNRERE